MAVVDYAKVMASREGNNNENIRTEFEVHPRYLILCCRKVEWRWMRSSNSRNLLAVSDSTATSGVDGGGVNVIRAPSGDCEETPRDRSG